MRFFTQFSLEEQRNCVKKAEEFIRNHRIHVAKRLEQAQHKTEPSGSDCFKPELWKGSHWAWYVFKLNKDKLNETET